VKKILLLVILAQSWVIWRQEKQISGMTWDLQYAIEQLSEAAFLVPPPPNIPREEALQRLYHPIEQ
jgi:hypothetical protein